MKGEPILDVVTGIVVGFALGAAFGVWIAGF